MSQCIGIDVGGTTSTVCVGDAIGNLHAISDQFSTRSADGPQATVDDLSAAIVATLERQQIPLADVHQVTLVTPGPATIEGVLLKSPNLLAAAWNQCPIREMLQTKLRQFISNVNVRYLGDGQAAALGEFAVRRQKVKLNPSILNHFNLTESSTDHELDSLFMVAVGTGFGGGEVRDGKVVQGHKGRAGHAGHLMLPYDAFRYDHDRRLVVGNAISTVESAVSLTALTHQLAYRLTLEQWKHHPLHQVDGGDKERAKGLRELAAAGDDLAMELLDDQARAMGIALLTIEYIGDYDLLIIGGGVCDLAPDLRDRYLKLAKQAFYDHALDGFRDFKKIEFSRCNDQASVIGAYVDATGLTRR